MKDQRYGLRFEGLMMEVEHLSIAGATLKVDLDALIANFRLVAARSAPAEIAAVVKADGYGLGAVPIAVALAEAGCRHFFVAQLSEAMALKPHLPNDRSVYILNGLQPGAEAACAEIGAIPVLNALHQVERWSGAAAVMKRQLPGVLQVDSGMARLGLSASEAQTLFTEPNRLLNIDLKLVMSHLACADDPKASANAAQLAAFTMFADHFPNVPRSLDNSGGAFLPRTGHFDLVRAGIALYGSAPQSGTPNPMHPVVRLEAPILQVREVSSGAGVGYGLTAVVNHPRRIATIGVGYADGWPRSLSNRGSVFIAGIRVPITGRVSMDSIILDVTGLPNETIGPGAAVELLGPHQSIDDVAADAGTISYEVLTRLGNRYERKYISSLSWLPCLN